MKTRKKPPARSSDRLFTSFSKKYTFFIPESHKNFFSGKDLELFLQARYQFFKRHTGEVRISAYKPDAQFLWLDASSVIEILMPDSPFIVDTIVDYCNANNYHVQLIIHPIFQTSRGADGRLRQMEFADGSGQSESYVYLEIERLSQAELAKLSNQLETNLKELRRVVTDYEKMIPLLDQLKIVGPAVTEEFEWLKENFVLLGLAPVKEHSLNGQYLGVFRKAGVRKKVNTELQFSQSLNSKSAILYHETGLRSTVNKNRQLYLALIHDGKRSYVLAGHFRHRAEISLRMQIPPIKSLVEQMAARLKAPPTSYMRKELYKTAQSLPVGLLLTRSPEMLFQWFVKAISNMYCTFVRYFLSVDDEYNIVWVEIVVPQAFAGQIPHRRLRRFQKAHDIEMVNEFRYRLNQVEVVFLGFRAQATSTQELADLLALHGEKLFSTWSSQFKELVYKKHSDGRSVDERLARYVNGISPDYEVHHGPGEALEDLDILEALKDGAGYQVGYRTHNDEFDLLKIYSTSHTSLSEIVPILDNFGFIIHSQHTFPYSVEGQEKFTFVFKVPSKKLEHCERVRISDAVGATLNRLTTSKPINELVRVGGINVRQLDLLKALVSYFFKINTSFAFFSIQNALVNYPQFSAGLVALFCARLGLDGNNKARTAARRAIAASFTELRSVLDENICKALVNVVEAIVRTNYFLDRPEISFKIVSSKINDMPKPVPHVEVFVYAYDMEGIHLRGGPVARGGIRWSDRQDDFRTEVLGLMKAQMVKNTVIVPVGSKGGFVLKNRTFDSRESFMAAGIDTYKRYMHCLLELTDNLSVAGSVIPAGGIRRLDGDDTYLVVAADKGTATFSDLANEISVGRKFWLTDAFASGGSQGYDHKKQGITAKGAWESVKRHFHEIGMDPEKDRFSAVGIGDMAGDVFGNGLLLSRTVRLVAVFNHLSIFLDPGPDPEISFQERSRLFDGGLNWNEYNSKLISRGGGVFDRASRRIELSPEIREVLAIKSKVLSGEALIKAILQAPVDLIWNGGIGTYVKAASESHFEVGDPTNDRVRVDAASLKAKVIAEGGNLGLTQAGRIEAAMRGIRLNTDAIDNSAGVNMSDHEVNLKILLGILLRKNVVKDQLARNKIIRRFDQDEVKLVLRQNYDDNLGLSLDTRRVTTQFIYFRSLIKFLNREGILDRSHDCIPFESELDKLEQGSRSLTRPVLCSLAGFAKLYGARVLLESDEFHDDWFDRYILRYFPAGISRKFADQIKAHPLKREIIVTEILNEIVNHGGIVFFQRLVMTTGQTPAAVAVAYAILSEFLDVKQLRSNIEAGGEWPNTNIHYEYLIHLEEKILLMTKKLMENATLQKALHNARSAPFSKMLNEAARYSTQRLPRKVRILLNMLDTEAAARIKISFRQVDILEDAFNIYVNNVGKGPEWPVSEYFSVLQQFRIKELRKIMQDLKAATSWEVLFFSKIDAEIEGLVARIFRAREKRGHDLAGKRQRVKTIVSEIIGLHSGSNLSMVSFYEMLQFINQRILG